MIIYIGGAPCTGKTTLASMLSTRLNIPAVSTDTIRKNMQNALPKEDNPDLFIADYTADDYLSTHTAHEVFVDQNKESEAVWPGIVEYVKPYVHNPDHSVIVEGVAILPNNTLAVESENSQYRPLFLIDSDIKRISKRVHERGVWDEAHLYPNHLKKIEVEWLQIANKWYEAEASRLHFAVLHISDIFDLDKVISLITRK